MSGFFDKIVLVGGSAPAFTRRSTGRAPRASAVFYRVLATNPVALASRRRGPLGVGWLKIDTCYVRGCSKGSPREKLCGLIGGTKLAVAVTVLFKVIPVGLSLRFVEIFGVILSMFEGQREKVFDSVALLGGLRVPRLIWFRI